MSAPINGGSFLVSPSISSEIVGIVIPIGGGFIPAICKSVDEANVRISDTELSSKPVADWNVESLV